MASVENEAKKVASTYARWLRNPEDALFGKGGEGCVSAMYKRIKQAHSKEEIRQILDLSQYQMERTTLNDLTRFVNDLNNKINPMTDEEAVKFVVEVFRYFQIALATKLHDINRGLWM